MQLVSKVVQVSVAKKNETVGYESTYKVRDNVEYIANIPAG
jgi:alanine racemase